MIKAIVCGSIGGVIGYAIACLMIAASRSARRMKK